MICDPLLAISPRADMEKSGLHDLHSPISTGTGSIAHGSLEHVLSMPIIVHAIRMHAETGSAINKGALPPLNMVAIIANHTARTTIDALTALPLIIGVRAILMRVVRMITVTTRIDHTDRIDMRTGGGTNNVRIMSSVIKVEAISSAISSETMKGLVTIKGAILHGTMKGAVIISSETRGTRIRARRVVLDFNVGRAGKRLMSVPRKKMSNLRVITRAIMHLDILEIDFRGMRIGVNTGSRKERSDMLLACQMGVF
jgi:hypothetical protein